MLSDSQAQNLINSLLEFVKLQNNSSVMAKAWTSHLIRIHKTWKEFLSSVSGDQGQDLMNYSGVSGGQG